LFGKLRPYLAKVSAPKFAGQCSAEALVLRPKPHIDPRFLRYRLVDVGAIDAVNASTYGAKMPRASWDFIGNMRFSIPDLPTQKAIADFLDRETARIDQLIEKKQRLVAVVKERRADFIHSTVTRGINPSTQFSSSGLNWAPELPSHWKPTRLKHLGQAVIGLTYSPEDLVPEGDGIPVLRANNIQSGQLVSEGLVFVSKEIPRKLILREGDIVICSRNGSRNLIGKNARVSGEFMGITFGAFNTVYRSRYSDFIYWVLQSPIFSYQAGAYLTSTINQLTVATLGNLVVPLPPPDEQKAICTHIERRMPAFNRLLDQVRTSIDRLKEYRSSLITAAVTGQIDVMAWSKRGHADRQFDAIQQEATS
jgi:type I restriction enzyme S subunit